MHYAVVEDKQKENGSIVLAIVEMMRFLDAYIYFALEIIFRVKRLGYHH